MTWSGRTCIGLALAAALLALLADAASPSVTRHAPMGGQRGTEVELTLSGARLQAPSGLLFYRPGIEVRSIEPGAKTGEQVRARLALAPDCPLGEHPFRLRTASGLSAVRIFRVGPFPLAEEVEPNNAFEQPQAVALNVTVEGVVKNEDVDYYAVEARKGDRLTAEIEGIRLGTAMFDPYVAILDAKRFERDVSDDTALLLQDSVASIVVPEDGRYLVQVRETSFAGSDESRYRLHIGTYPRPRAVHPAGGAPGETVTVRYLGDVAGPLEAAVPLPAQEGPFDLYAQRDGLSAPSPNLVRVFAGANVREAEPNNERGQATASDAPPALAFDGLVGAPGDRDWYRFKATKGQELTIDVLARRLRSPLDPTLALHGPDGNKIADNDDAEGPDSHLDFKPPADGEYTLVVTDHLGAGGESFAYRVEIRPVAPTLALSVPVFKKDTQEYQAAAVPRGNRFAILLAAKRDNLSGALQAALDGLPAGVKAIVPDFVDGADQVPVLFEAAPDAPLAGALVDVRAKGKAGEREVPGRFAQTVELVRGNPNNTVYYKTTVDRLALAVTEEAPFRLELDQPKAALPQAGSLRLRVKAERKPGFDGVIAIKLVHAPAGVSSSSDLSIPAGQSALEIALNAAGDAATRTTRIVVIGSAQVGGGELWVSSGYADLEVCAPWVRGKLLLATVQRGAPAEVVCGLEQLRPFEGPARLRLFGLPPKTSAEEKTFTREAKEVVFQVKTEPDSPTGQHKSLFCSMDLQINGESIQQTITPTGTLRIDPVPAATVAEAKPAPPPTPAPAAEKRLSRLEQLRRQQQ